MGHLQPPAVEAVAAVSAGALGRDERFAGEDLQVLRHLWLPEAGGVDELGNGRLTPLVEQLEQEAAVRLAGA